MSDVSYFTEEGLSKLKDELHLLKTVGRKKIAQQIAEARDKGDLSENAEYDAAKEAQGLHELKISKLETSLSNAKVIDKKNIDASKVSILSKVDIKNLQNNMKFTYQIVAEEESDLKSGKLSVKSPIGSSLLGKIKGDRVLINTPSGNIKFEILNISL
ncbi:MAG: transcription elongation factor GreA [Flammeovirgaceae bacterium]|nr:transcription elongation factor GreA [Flammeovirgaceae bacterium]|tara:strand:- start:13348 stop:13821 length:474 start_codon:yes stop_codon:yes gene_type:complete